MAFRCPQCLAFGTLQIERSLQLPPDNRSDDIMVQIVRCDNCQFEGLAVYEESRRGAWDSDAWEHTGYRLQAQALDPLLVEIRACPQPANPRCGCPAHFKFSQMDRFGNWPGIPPQAIQSTFPMHLTD